MLKQGTITEEEKKIAEEKIKAKEEEKKKQQEETEQKRKASEAKSEEAFDEFIKSGGRQGIRDDMSLQDIFKQYYNRAHSLDISNSKVVNSALSSINSLSSRLDKRRQAAKLKREQKEKQGDQQNQEAKDHMSASEAGEYH
jgi:hypothetical protein